jgi:hypothetical protein
MSNEQQKEQGQDNGKTATSGVYTNFASAPADSNVNPPGKPLSGEGSAVAPVAGGTQGGFEASRSMQDGAGAAGGDPGTTADGRPEHHPGTEASDEQQINPANADQSESRRDS